MHCVPEQITVPKRIKSLLIVEVYDFLLFHKEQAASKGQKSRSWREEASTMCTSKAKREESFLHPVHADTQIPATALMS